MCILCVDIQRWHIVAPRLKVRLEIKNKNDYIYALHDSSPSSILFNDQSWDAWSKLARPALFVPGKENTRTVTRSMVRRRPVTFQLSKLESLPSELLALILEDSSLEKEDVLALGLASETLWSHVVHHVRQDCLRAATPLAGVEIACVGTHLLDLPDAFRKGDLFRLSVPDQNRWDIVEARNMNWEATEHYTCLTPSPGTLWTTAFDATSTTTSGVSSSLSKKLFAELASNWLFVGTTTSLALKAPWVLRNLTTKEYVHCRTGSTVKHGYVTHPDAENLRVDDILLMRICWTRDDVYPLNNSAKARQPYHRGKWAGHCFDIVPLSQLASGIFSDPENKSSEWKDCTDEIVKEALEAAKHCHRERAAQLRVRKRLLKMRKRSLDRKALRRQILGGFSWGKIKKSFAESWRL